MDCYSIRYERQIPIEEIGLAGQERIRTGSVLVIGAGGLGCPAITALAQAGIGRIGIMDGDKIAMNNLNRQFLYTPMDLGKDKAVCAADWVKKFRPDCQVDVWQEYMDDKNAGDIIKDFDVVLSAVDRIATRLVINRKALEFKVPLIDGALDGLYGTVTAVLGDGGPCLACVHPQGREPDKKPDAFGATAMVIGALQAQYAIAILAKIPIRWNHLLCYDGMSGTIEGVQFERNPHCPVCGR